MNQSRELLETIESFDSNPYELTTTARLQAATDFKTACEDAMLENMWAVRDFEPTKDNPIAVLRMQIKAEDGSKLAFFFKSTDTEAADLNHPYSLTMQEVDHIGRSVRYVRYDLSRDSSEVTKLDLRAIQDNHRSREVVGMGYNEKPVSPAEIITVTDLISIADPIRI